MRSGAVLALIVALVASQGAGQSAATDAGLRPMARPDALTTAPASAATVASPFIVPAEGAGALAPVPVGAGLRPLARPTGLSAGQGDAVALNDAATPAEPRTVAEPWTVAEPRTVAGAAALDAPNPAAPNFANPVRPQSRPVAILIGQGDAVVAGPLRPVLRPLWIVTDHGAALTPAASPRTLGRQAALPPGMPGLAVPGWAAPASVATEIGLSTRGIALPLPRLLRSERLTGDMPAVAALLVPAVLRLPVTVDGWPGSVPPLRTTPVALIVPQTTPAPGLRPQARPAAAAQIDTQTAAQTATLPVALIVPGVAATLLTPMRPPPRPADMADRVAALRVAAAVVIPVMPRIGPQISELAVGQSLRPSQRPDDLRIVPVSQRVADPAPSAQTQRGAVCGDAAIQGEVLGSVPGPGACGVEDAVRVRSVGGVRLTQPATMTCDTARALARWVQTGAKEVVGNTGGGLDAIQVTGHYACRGRNNQAGARLSEHAFGHAIDIGGFILNDGSRVSVLNNWGGGSYGQMLRRLHATACGPFGTVLGPEANRFHRDHFHFDSASHRSGSYCR